MTATPQQPGAAPNLVFADAIMLAYRLGLLRYDEQKEAMLMAAQQATDAIGYLAALESHGLGTRSKIHAFVGKFLSAPAFYRAQHARLLGLHAESQQPPTFLGNQQVPFLVEGVLTFKQQTLFNEAFWWFVHNHKPHFTHPHKGHCIGVYATLPHDNSSCLDRFETLLTRLASHDNSTQRQRYASLPIALVMAILRRAFL